MLTTYLLLILKGMNMHYFLHLALQMIFMNLEEAKGLELRKALVMVS